MAGVGKSISIFLTGGYIYTYGERRYAGIAFGTIETA
jgi:hypothetical protein